MITRNLLLVFSLGAFSHAGEVMILESKFAVNLQAVVKQKGNGHSVSVSGICGHSSYAVKETEVTTDGNVIILVVKLAPAKKGLIGSFNKSLTVPDHVDKIVFGMEKKVIWTRASRGGDPTKEK